MDHSFGPSRHLGRLVNTEAVGVKAMKPLDRIRDYVVWGRMAEGGRADIWLARHVGLSAAVVIKTLKLAGLEGDHAG
jgi:hypothetical protein